MNSQSIKDKLKNIARNNNRLYQEVLTVFALERTIYRISISEYRENFTLKGGIFLYALYEKNYPRSTADIDLMAEKINGSENSMRTVFSEIFSISCDDGIEYDYKSLAIKKITKLDEYQGVNVSIKASLGNIRIPVSIDIGFGDVIVPERTEIDFPVLLDLEVPHVYSYSIESTLAEKFEAIVSLGLANSRYKDFYDIYVILRDRGVDKGILRQALVQTFSNRKTSFDDIVIFEDSFMLDEERQKRWGAFTKKKSALVQVSFETVVSSIRDFFAPIIREIKEGTR